MTCGFAFRESNDIVTKVSDVSDNAQQLQRTESHVMQDQSVANGIIDIYFWWCNSLFHHPIVMLCCTLEIILYFVYISWALFLVSLGTTSGLTTDQAVFLSTSGGIGGLFGKVTAVVMFHYSKMTPVTGCFVPVLVNGFSLLCCAVSNRYYMMMVLIFVSGICMGVATNALFGLMSSLVCKGHFQQAMVITLFSEGIRMQLGGLISGEYCTVTQFKKSSISFWWIMW